MSIRRRAHQLTRGMAAAAFLAAAHVAAQAAEPPPRRIVSANLCADRLVLQLADRENVISVSHYAADPAVSTVAEAARGIRINQGNVEDIVSLHPDIVIFGAFNSMSTGAMLRSMGIRVHELPPADSIASVRSVIRDLASTLGVPDSGERMISDMDARLAALPVRGRPVKAAVYQAGGWSAGRDTMADDLFGRVGFTNIAAEAGIVGFGALPLESLVAASPEVIVVESAGEDMPSIAGDLLRHPALARGGVRRVGVPMRLWACPDSALVEAAALIAGGAP